MYTRISITANFYAFCCPYFGIIIFALFNRMAKRYQNYNFANVISFTHKILKQLLLLFREISTWHILYHTKVSLLRPGIFQCWHFRYQKGHRFKSILHHGEGGSPHWLFSFSFQSDYRMQKIINTFSYLLI